MGNVDTTIGHDTIVVSGDVWVSPETIGDSLMGKRFFWSLVVGDVIMIAWIPQFGSGIHFAISSAGGPMGEWAHHWMDVSEVPEDGLEFSYSITVGGFHIRRSYGLDAMGMPARGRMKPNEANPSPNPTHSIEMYAADNWVVDTEPGVLNVRLGEVEWNGVNGPNPPPDDDPDPPDFYTVNVVPSDCLNVVFEGVYDLAAPGTYCTTSVSTNYLDYDFSLIDELVVIDPPTQRGVHVTGSGNTVNWWSDDGVDGEVGWGFQACPPAAVSWENYGLCDWGENTHNSRYDGVLVWGGFRKVPEMDGKITWPKPIDTEVGGEEDDDWEEGVELPVPLGELRALGTYIQPQKEAQAIQFWGGPNISLRVDRKSHIKHNLYPKGDFEHPLRFPIGIPHLLDPMPDTNPHFLVGAIRSDVDVDIPELLDGRPSAWVSYDYSVDGGGIGSDEPVEFTVNGAGTLFREFKSNWLPRCEAFIAYANATGNWAVFPSGYFVHRANYMLETYDDWDWDDIYAKTGYREEDEDVVWWSSHRYLLLSAGGPQSADEKEVIATLDYYVESVSDDHVLDLTGPSGKRGIECSLSGPFTHEMVGVYDHSKQRIVFDLAEPLESIPDLRHVHKMTIHFDNGHVGDWVLNGLRLMHDDNEPVALVTMHEARHAYVSGGVRGVVNGLYPKALMTSGNFRTYAGQEELAELIDWNWTKTLHLMQDGSAAWRLDDFMVILSGACEGWQWSLPENWDEMVTDENGNTLTVGYSFDLLEAQGRDIDLGYPARISAYRWQTAPQLVYKPHGVVCVQGGLHGLSEDKSASSGIEIFRRANDEDDWVLLRNLGTDADGYWATGEDIVESYDELTPNFWRYKTDDNDFARLYERQWQAAYAIIEQRREPDLAEDGMGRMVVAYLEDGAVWAARIDSLWRGTEPPVLIAKSATAVAPAIELLPDGVMVVTFTDDAGSYAYASTDGGSTWGQIA